MAVAYRSSSSVATVAYIATIDVPVPSGAAAGDIALVCLGRWESTNPAITPPAGFTMFIDVALGNMKLHVFWKRLTGADSGNYTFSWTGQQWTGGGAILFTGGLAVGDPVTVFNTASTGGSSTVPTTTTSSTTFQPGLAHFVANDDPGTGTAPTNYTEVQDSQTVKVNYWIPGANGVHTAASGTVSVSTDMWAALVAVEPDPDSLGGGVTAPIYKVADRGSITNTSAASTTAIDMAAAGSVKIGNYLIVRTAVDNSGASGARPGLTVTDPRSNTWTTGTGALQDPGAANAGAACYISYAKITNALVDGDDLTLTWGTGTPTADSTVIEEWAGIHPTSPVAVAETQTNGASGTPSISRTPTAAGQMFYGAIAAEGPTGDSYTEDADTTDGSWVSLTKIGGNSGTATNDMTVTGAYKVVTGVTAQTWNPTITSRDWAQAALVFAPSRSTPADTRRQYFRPLLIR